MRKLPLVLVSLLALWAGALHGQLFAPVDRELAATAPASTGPLSAGIMKTIEVAVNSTVLAAEVFDLEVDGVRFRATGSLRQVSREHQVWSGTLEDGAGGEGSMVLTRYRAGTWGQINGPAGTWVIETRGVHTYLHEVDPQLTTTKECGVVDTHLADLETAAALYDGLAIPATADDSVIEVQFWYTRERLAEIGSLEDLLGLTLAQLDIANEALAKTGTGLLPFRFAYLLPVPESHTESGDVWEELGWFLTDATVKRWHDYPTPPSTIRPDVQVLLIQNSGTEGAGVGAVNGTPDHRFAHAVIGDWKAAGSGMGVLAHELGHILGLVHDRVTNPEVDPFYESARGWFYQIPTGEWRSCLMTYVSACPGGCRKQWHYSNPRNLDEGVPTGDYALADGYAMLTKSTRYAANYRITDVFGPSTFKWSKKKKKAWLNVRIEIPAMTSTSAMLFRGLSKDGKCQGKPFATVPFKAGVAARSFKMPVKPASVCVETVQGPKVGTVGVFQVAGP